MSKTMTNNKRDFISLLSSMSHEDINRYIREHGKPPKKVSMCHIIDKDKYNTLDKILAMRNIID